LFHLKVRVLLLLLPFALALAEGVKVSPDAIVRNYCAAERRQALVLRRASMEVDIQASLPGLKKEGRFHGLRRISPLGLISYERRRFEGDKTVRNQVILRYLAAEEETQKEDSPARAVTPDNYKFKFKRKAGLDGRAVYVFGVTARRKRQGLFDGELWIDAATYLRVREAGRLVHVGSFFVKKNAFVRTYEIRGGISVPHGMQSTADIRLVGKAELNIAFSNFSLDDAGDGQ
jgi:hypothetical protein